MSVHWSNAKKRFFICYKAKQPDGTFKTVSIYNRNWTKDRGKRYVQQMEEALVRDARKAKNPVSAKRKGALLYPFLDKVEGEWKTEYKAQTAYHKNHIVEKYVKGYFNESKSAAEALSQASLADFRGHVAALPLTADWKNKILITVRQLLDKAGEKEIMGFEAVARAKAVLKPFPIEMRKEKLSFWTDGEWARFIGSFDDSDKFKMLFKVTYVCGLRLGELLALKWSDFSQEKKTISVNKAMDNLGNISTTKNRSSSANVSIPGWLASELSEYKRGFAASPDDWMFFAGKRTSRTTIRRVMRLHIESSGVPFIRFHGLRHSCASHLIHEGMSPLLVARHLRHSSVKETLDTYSHLFPGETSNMVEALFKAEPSSKDALPSEMSSKMSSK